MDSAAALGTPLMSIGRSPRPRNHEHTKQERVVASRCLRGDRRRSGVTLLVTVLLLLVGHHAIAGDKYAVVISGASGGEAYAKKYEKWRTSFTELLREKCGSTPEPLIGVDDTRGQGGPNAPPG